jgi:hypothetical protein
MRTPYFWLSLLMPLIAPAPIRSPAIDAIAQVATVAPGVAKVAPVPGLARIAILGASLSDGFGLDLDVGARTLLADVVDATLKSEHGPLSSKASGYFFMDPAKAGREQVEAVRTKDPTLVIGLDYLFWFGYGRVKAEQDRLARFESGLALLEGFTCPVLVGDLPDMSQALEGESPLTHGPLLQRQQVPAPETLKALNARLAEWSSKHPNVVVVPIAKLLARLHAREEIDLRGNVWPAGASQRLFQKDLLHPTLEGSIAVWLFALDDLVRAQAAFPAGAFEWDAKAIWKRVYAAKEPERTAKLEKARLEKERAEARVKARAAKGESKDPAPR